MRIYIASPYTIGDTDLNVRRQLEVADELMNLGYTPYVPLLSHFQHLVFPRSYKDWLEHDIEWLKVCDCVLRLKGKSKGADKEVRTAKELKIPVYYSIKELEEIKEKEKTNELNKKLYKIDKQAKKLAKKFISKIENDKIPVHICR